MWIYFNGVAIKSKIYRKQFYILQNSRSLKPSNLEHVSAISERIVYFRKLIFYTLLFLKDACNSSCLLIRNVYSAPDAKGNSCENLILLMVDNKFV
mgnify:CR=1 FL=1